jgi:hypothetical protein
MPTNAQQINTGQTMARPPAEKAELFRMSDELKSADRFVGRCCDFCELNLNALGPSKQEPTENWDASTQFRLGDGGH